jgi:integrating conjugative element protein (TIGR03755 family)
MTNIFNNHLTQAVLALSLIWPGANIQAAPTVPAGEQSWYYAIGGAEPISAVLNPYAPNWAMTGHPSLSASYSCGKFDITTSVSNAFSSVVTNVKNQVMSAARGAIAALPLYIFQRALPGLYEQFQSFSADFSLDFNNAVKSCEQIEQEILAGKDPYAEWIEIAKAGDWRRLMQSNADPVDVKQQVETDGGRQGLPFPKISRGSVVHAGGDSGPPIEPIQDITAAGWNVIVGRGPANNTSYTPSAHARMRLSKLFHHPAAAAAYARDVLGDMMISTCPGCPKRAIPGQGLGPKFDQHRQWIARNLTMMINTPRVPTADELKSLSAPGVAISARVIESLRELPPEERAILAGRLAAEAALARTIEEALAIRRMLITGKRVPEIASVKPATEMAEKAIEELEKEIDNMLFEQRVNKEIASNTASIVIARRNQLDANSQQVIRQSRPEKTHLDTQGRFK